MMDKQGMKRGLKTFLLPAIICGFPALSVAASVSLFSDYGQIQNVQNYSSNPFWSPDSPYNQRLPQPVYVQGAAVKTNECQNIVQSLVAAQCISRNNCKNTQLSDIRPAIMVQLSNLPGKNYVSSCSGYLDEIFNDYVKQYAVGISGGNVGFPAATTPNPDMQNTGSITTAKVAKPVPKWQQEINERTQELQALHQQTGNNTSLSATEFPTTYADRSFSDKIQDTVKSYEPYKNLNAYKMPNFVSEDQWCPSHKDAPECEEWRLEHEQSNNGSNKTPKTPAQFKSKHKTT